MSGLFHGPYCPIPILLWYALPNGIVCFDAVDLCSDTIHPGTLLQRRGMLHPVGLCSGTLSWSQVYTSSADYFQSSNSICNANSFKRNLKKNIKCKFLNKYQEQNNLITQMICVRRKHTAKFVFCPGPSDSSYSPVTKTSLCISSLKHFFWLGDKWNIKASTFDKQTASKR